MKNAIEELPIRERALEAVRNYKHSWVEVARIITDIAYGGDYKEWEYEDFETYCQEELGLKLRQARKMMRSYSYLKHNRPEQLKAIVSGEDVPCPGYEIINDIEAAQGSAERDGRYDANSLKEVETKLFEGNISGREATQGIKEARIAPGDIEPPDPTVKQMRKITTEYRRLCSQVKQNERIPEEVATLMEQALARLLELTE